MASAICDTRSALCRHRPQLKTFALEPFEFGRERRSDRRAARQPLDDLGVVVDGGGDDDAAARAGEALEARGDVDRRAEVVEPVVERDGHARAGVNPYFNL